MPVASTHGDVTISAAFVDRSPRSIAAQFDIADVVLHVDTNRSERLETLNGRFEWAREADDSWLLAVTDINVHGRDLFAPRSDFAIAAQPAAPGRGRSIKASASFLRLQDIYPLLRVADRENLLEAIKPEGFQLPWVLNGDVESFDLSLQGVADSPAKFSIVSQFSDVGVLAAGDGNPVREIAGISGELAADQDGGRVQIDGRASKVELPLLFTAPINMQSISGLLIWRVTEDVVRVLSDNIQVRMEFLDADTRFELDWPRNGDSAQIDLTGTGIASDARRLLPLLPLKKFPASVAGWLDRAIVAGRVPRADIKFSGPLRGFPFDAGEGVFNIDIDVEDAVLDFSDHWPRVNNFDARIVFDGVSLTSRRNSGHIGSIGFRDSHVEIADLRKGRLEIRGQQTVAVDAALKFLRQSPVGTAIGPVIDKFTGSGTALANLQLVVPVLRPAEYELEIEIDANGVQLGMTGLDWGLTDLRGNLTVRNTQFYAQAMTATLLDETVTLDLRPADDVSDPFSQYIDITGRTPLRRWMQTLSLPFADRIDGPADWSAQVMIPRRQAESPAAVRIVARSDLVGVESRLPDPLAKTFAQARALEVDIAFPAEGQLEVAGQLHSDLTWIFELESANGAWRIARGAVHGGSAAAIVPAGRGVELSGQLDFLRFDDWLALTETESGNAAATQAADWRETWRAAVFDINRLAAFGQLFADVRLQARQDGENWQIELQGPALAGQITVPLDLDNGQPINLDMERLWLVDTDERGEGGVDRDSADPRLVPSINVEAADFVINDMQFGALSATIKRVAGGILIEPIRIRAPSFSIDGDAAWLVHPNDDSLRQSQLALSLVGSDIAAVFAALGYDPVVGGESIVASGELAWLGGPGGDILERADGQFTIRMDEGSLLAVDPGSGRLLGVLSIAALPRRLSFDFSDVFDDGLSFKTLKGDFTIDDGNAYTCNLGLEGSVADMGIVGRTGFEARDYDQLAVVRPHVSNLLAVGGTAVGGPVVGAAMLLFSQIFRKPLSTLGESYYSVSGSWDDPLVEQVRGNDLGVAPLRNCETYLADAISESLKQ